MTTLAACIVAASNRDRMAVARALAEQHRAEATARVNADRMAELRRENERLAHQLDLMRAAGWSGGDAA